VLNFKKKFAFIELFNIYYTKIKKLNIRKYEQFKYLQIAQKAKHFWEIKVSLKYDNNVQ
jgi:hypothetical protein